MEGNQLTKSNTRIARIMDAKQAEQELSEQRALDNERRAREQKMLAVQQAVTQVIPLLDANHLGDTVTLQLWTDRSGLCQAGKDPNNSKKWGRQTWSKKGNPADTFARLKDINPQRINSLDSYTEKPTNKLVGPILYLRSDNSLWLQQSDNHPLWPLSCWHSRSGALLSATMVETSLDRLLERLTAYAEQLEESRVSN